MKKLLILLTTTLLFNGIIWAQCPTGNVYFYTQSDIDNFTANYPGCTQMPGSMIIDTGGSPTNLNGLSQITTVDGDLKIIAYVTDISGLSNLTTVGRDLAIEYGNLVNLEGLESLVSVGRNLSIISNGSLISLTGLDNLTYIGNNINIEDNYNLTDLVALSNINQVTGNLQISDSYGFNDLTDLTNLTAVDGNFTIKSNLNLPTLNGLENLTTIGGSLNIESNLNLPTLNGLENLSTIGGNLNIFDEIELVSVQSLANLTAIGGELIIELNSVLADLNGLENIDPTTITNLKIRSNDELSLCGINSICDYLAAGGTATIGYNASGCDTQAEIEAACATAAAICPTGNVVINSQSDIDNFPTNYPGCTVIDGNLEISFFAIDVTNLAGLNQLTAINGNLEFELGYITDFSGLDNLETIGGDFIVEFTEINNFQGLESLTSIGGDFRLAHNFDLNSFTGLSSLASIGGTFRTSSSDNGPVTDFTGLEALSLIGGDFILEDTGSFSSFDGLENLSSIGGDFFVEWGFTSIQALSNLNSIGGNFTLGFTLLTNLAGLENLTTIPGDFLLYNNDNLNDISHLSNLNTIGGRLSINDNYNTGFTNLSGLENLTSIGGALNISYNFFLTNLTSLENLDHTSITNLTIKDNFELSVCGVTSICNYLAAGGTATISSNAFGCATQAEVENTCVGGSICPPGSVTISTQQEIDDFPINYPGCTVISGNLIIIEGFTDPITNLNGLSQIEMITGNFVIGDYVNVPDLTAFNNLTSVGGNLSFDNSRINSLDGLENLSSVGGNLTFEDNASLTDISGLSGLTSIGGHLTIINNNSLSNLIGLENLTVIGGILNISDNAALATLSAIDGLDHTSIIYLIIENNSNLSVCSVTSVCNYLAAGGPPASIFNNASGCNAQAEVEVVCNDPCLATPVMSVNDQPISNGIYQAANEVNSIGTVPVGGNVNFKAGQIILLDGNFTVESNADFSAEIEDCGQ